MVGRGGLEAGMCQEWPLCCQSWVPGANLVCSRYKKWGHFLYPLAHSPNVCNGQAGQARRGPGAPPGSLPCRDFLLPSQTYQQEVEQPGLTPAVCHEALMSHTAHHTSEQLHEHTCLGGASGTRWHG